MIIPIQEVLNTSVKPLYPWLRGQEEINRVGRKGREDQYRFYVWLSKQINNSLIIDLGTRKGTSAVAFANNRTNQVWTYDIRTYDFQGAWEDRDNLHYVVADVLSLPPSTYDDAAILHLDLLHDGETERQWLDKVDQSNFSGLLIMDDVNYGKFPGLMQLWNSLKRRKLLLPPGISHFSGTGLVPFNDEPLEVVP